MPRGAMGRGGPGAEPPARLREETQRTGAGRLRSRVAPVQLWQVPLPESLYVPPATGMNCH